MATHPYVEPFYESDGLKVLAELGLTPEEGLALGVCTEREAVLMRNRLDGDALREKRRAEGAIRVAEMEREAANAGPRGFTYARSGDYTYTRDADGPYER